MTFQKEISEKTLFLLREKGESKGIYSILDFNRIHIIYDSYPHFLTVFSDTDVVFQTLENEVITFSDGIWIDQINNYYQEAYKNAEIESTHP